MARFQAVSIDEPPGDRLAFEAAGVGDALAILAEQRPCAHVELWQEGRLLAHLQHVLEDGASFWRFG